ncbi:unnamed protein product [Amoebophrya sp. A25]|nr:unnamed protein product [Amoebophrya sp. A25]|eukprot:GSA25T00011738001.1
MITILLLIKSKPRKCEITQTKLRKMNPYEEKGMQMMMAGTFSQDVMLAFERADLQEGGKRIEDNWEKWGPKLAIHALASYRTFQWSFFRGWLQKNQGLTGVLNLLQDFKKHPAAGRAPRQYDL